MNVIELGLGEGKSTALVKIMMEPGNADVIFVAPTRRQAVDIGQRLAFNLGMSAEDARGRFISASQVETLPKGRLYRFVVDEADAVFASLLGGKVVAAAHTTDAQRDEYHAARRAGRAS